MLDSIEGHKEKIIRVVIQGLSMNLGTLFYRNILLNLFSGNLNLRNIVTT